jgi:Big-like domain-containing protein
VAHRLDPVTRYYLFAALLAGAAIVYACTTDTAIGPDVALASLYIEPDSAVMVLDDTLGLTAVGVDSTGRRFAHTRVRWSTSGTAISLSPNGVVVALGTGTATVTANAGDVSATAVVTVTPKPIFATSRDTVPLTGIASGPDPAPQTVTITNAGGGTLAPAVDSIRYGPGATGWLQAAIATGVPDTLTVTAATAGLAISSYSATVFLGAPNATPKSITVVLSVTAGAAATMAIDSGDAQTATVNHAVAVKPTVIIRDQYGNPVPSVGVTFAVSSGGGTALPALPVPTDAAGRARAASWTLGTAAGPNQLQASASGLTLVTFSAAGTPDVPTTATKTAGDSQAVTVNTAVPVQPTVRVTDQFGNPVESVTVAFSVALGGGGVTGPTRKTGSTGQAAVGSWTVGTQATQNTLTATPTGLSAVTFSATANPDVADSIKLSAGNAQTDTVAATLAAYSVRIADQYGNGVPGTTVNWGVTGGGSITPSSISNGSGIASATRVLGAVAGPQGATASVAGLTGSPVGFSATATHGAATTILKFAGDGQSATAGSTVSNAPTAKVVDQFGNAVPGVTVTFAVTAGGGGVTPGTPIATDTAGKATVTSWTLGPAAGTNNNTLTASAPGLSSVGFVASGLSGAAKNLVYVSGDAQTDTIGASLAAYTVRVTDSLGNGVQSVTVSWLVTAGGGSITLSSQTDGNGFATATRVLGTAAGVDSATASVGGLTGSPQRFGATALHGNPAQIFKTAGDVQTATVNTTVATALQARITDRAGNPIQSANVTFTAAPGNGTLVPASPATLATDAGGFVQITSWTLATTARTDSVSATSAGTPGATFTATGTPDAPSASQSSVVDGAATIIACSASCTVAGSTADSVTVTVRDQFNNLVSGASVTVSSTGTSNAFSPSATGATNANGVFAAKLNSTVAEAKTISAAGVTQTAAVTVNPTAVSTSFSSVAASATPLTACQTSCSLGTTAATITATVRDTFNNIVNGASVTLGATGTSNYFNTVLQNSVSGSSAGGGTYSATYNSSTAQLKTLSATITSGTVIGENTAVTINAAAPASVTVANQGFSARVGTGVGTLPTYTVRDAFSNLVPNFAVTYSSLNSGAFTGPATTNGSGQVTLTSWTMSGGAADDASGRMANSVSVTAGSASAAAIDYGIYTWLSDVRPVIGPSGSSCSSCHALDRNPNNIVGFASSCGGIIYVVAGNAGASFVYQKIVGTQACGNAMPPPSGGLSALNIKIVRAWINNGALNN